MFESEATEPVEEADGQIEIVSAEAVKANEILVTLAEAVDADDTTIKVTKGTNTIAVEADWADTNDSVVLTTPTNMSEGTYTVTLTSVEDETNTDSAVFEVTGRYVAEIVITNDIALTNADKDEAYAYYDVLDQYGESMRTSASVQWTGSCVPSANKTTGQIKLTKNDGSDWVYNDQIYLTGVYTKTGITCQKTLTVGTEQSLDKIELKGFVKKGTTEILDSLPAGFKEDTYYLIYNAVDQNGDPLKIGAAVGAVTFVSDNVLVVKQIDNPIENGLTIGGNEYEASFVQPGIKVQDGGDVTVTAIATKTGNKSELDFTVGQKPVIQSFSFGTPASTVADGDEDVKIPFTALDADGNEITDFDTIARQKTFNELTLEASEGTLVLKEEDDGTAALYWTDDQVTYGYGSYPSDSLNGIDRPVNFTAVVVSGESDNTIISVSDKRRPDAIAAVDASAVYVEGDELVFSLDSFKYYDQYGQLIGDDYGDDNGFFYASVNPGLNSSDIDLNGYTFGVRVNYAGSGEMIYAGETGTVYTDDADNTPADVTKAVIVPTVGGSTVTFATKTDIATAAANEGFKFEIVKNKTAANNAEGQAAEWESASTQKYTPMTVVDISQVRNFTATTADRLYLGKVKNGETVITGSGLTTEDAIGLTVNGTDGTGLTSGNTNTYTKKVKVTGTYNGEEVTIPVTYYHVAGSKVSDGLVSTGDTAFDGLIDTIVTNGLKATDLYDKTSAKLTSKIASDTIKAQIQRLYGTAEDVTFYVGAEAEDGTATDLDADDVTLTRSNTTVAAGSTRAALQEAFAAANEAIAELTADTLKTADFSDALTADQTTAIKTELMALNAELFGSAVVFDTASVSVELSDQDSKATAITNVADEYVLNPTLTDLGEGDEDDMKSFDRG